LAKTTVDHRATDPRVSTLTLRLKRQDEERLEQAWNLARDCILRHLKSSSSDLQIDARRDLMRLLVLGDPPLLRGAPTETPGDFTSASGSEAVRAPMHCVHRGG
jgi:hypothetical protein